MEDRLRIAKDLMAAEYGKRAWSWMSAKQGEELELITAALKVADLLIAEHEETRERTPIDRLIDTMGGQTGDGGTF